MGIIQLIFLVVGIYGLVQLPKVKKARADEYPELTENDFDMWQQKKLKSIYYYLWAGWGVIVFNLSYI